MELACVNLVGLAHSVNDLVLWDTMEWNADFTAIAACQMVNVILKLENVSVI